MPLFLGEASASLSCTNTATPHPTPPNCEGFQRSSLLEVYRKKRLPLIPKELLCFLSKEALALPTHLQSLKSCLNSQWASGVGALRKTKGRATQAHPRHHNYTINVFTKSAMPPNMCFLPRTITSLHQFCTSSAWNLVVRFHTVAPSE